MQVDTDWCLLVEFNSFNFLVNGGFPLELKHKKNVQLFSGCIAYFLSAFSHNFVDNTVE